MKKDNVKYSSKGTSGIMTNRRQLLAFGAAVTAMSWLGPKTGWAQTTLPATPPSTPTGQVVIGFSQEPTVFQPLLPHIEVDEGVYASLFSTLWRIDEKDIPRPDLISEIPTVDNGGVSADGISWHLKLKPDAKWHDGKPFTAEDVKFNIELIQNPKFMAGHRGGIDQIDNVKVLSPTELTFNLKAPYAPLMAVLSSSFLVPKHLLEHVEDINRPVAFLDHPIGTGPFKWGERIPGDHLTLVASQSYHGNGPHLEKLIFKYVPEMTVLYTQFQTGDVDYVGIAGISPDHYEEAKALSGRKGIPVPQPFVECIPINLGIPIFHDPAVREALYLAIDKETIVEQIYYGLPTATESFLPKQSWAFNPDLKKHEYNPEKAKKILDDAGWKIGADGVREKDGLRLDFSNSTTAGNPTREQVQQILQQGWLDIGVRMTIKNFPPAVMWGDYWNLSKYDTAIAGGNFTVGSDPDVSQWFSSKGIPVRGGGGNNTMQYVSSESDTLLTKGAAEVDMGKRKPIYLKLQEVIRNELPVLPLFQDTMVEGIKDGLLGFVPNVNVQENSWNTNTWYWAT